MTEISFREFIFQKCYAEEMIKALKTCAPLVCDGCHDEDKEHTCLSRHYFLYWEQAKYFINLAIIYQNVNIKLAKYNLEEMSHFETYKMLLKLDKECIPYVQALVSILDL